MDAAQGGGPAGELDDATLVVRAREGDVAAFETLARRHQHTLHRVAVRVLGDATDAEDALQDAFLHAWRRLGEFRGDAAFGSWMYRIVTRRCVDQLRRRSAVPVDPADAEATAPPAPGSTERTVEVGAQMAALRCAVDGLPPDQRVAWVLRELEGLGYAQIAEITGASEDAARGRIHRARVRLAEVMRPWR